MLSPYDLDSFIPLENLQKVKIDQLVKAVNNDLKKALLQAKIRLLSSDVELVTSKARFSGVRYWFSCPLCKKRVGILYTLPDEKEGVVSCRMCTNKLYYKQMMRNT